MKFLWLKQEVNQVCISIGYQDMRFSHICILSKFAIMKNVWQVPVIMKPTKNFLLFWFL